MGRNLSWCTRNYQQRRQSTATKGLVVSVSSIWGLVKGSWGVLLYGNCPSTPRIGVPELWSRLLHRSLYTFALFWEQ